jgi:hypothetical protein
VKGGKKEMIERKGQQDIIVTVLLVLIALAAVALIATFIINNVREGTGSADDSATCLKINLEITSATDTSVVVKRLDGEAIDNAKLKVIVGGEAEDDNPDLPAAGVSKTVTITGGASKLAEVTVMLEDGYTCPIKASKEIPAIPAA